MYMEDLDLSYRLAQAGWLSWYEPAATVMHVKGGTIGGRRSPRLNWHFHRGMYRFYRHHYAPQRSVALNALVYAGIAVKLAAAVAQSAARRSLARLRQRRRTALASDGRVAEHLGRRIGLGGPRPRAAPPTLPAAPARGCGPRRPGPWPAPTSRTSTAGSRRGREHAPFAEQIAATEPDQVVLARASPEPSVAECSCDAARVLSPAGSALPRDAAAGRGRRPPGRRRSRSSKPPAVQERLAARRRPPPRDGADRIRRPTLQRRSGARRSGSRRRAASGRARCRPSRSARASARRASPPRPSPPRRPGRARRRCAST